MKIQRNLILCLLVLVASHTALPALSGAGNEEMQQQVAALKEQAAELKGSMDDLRKDAANLKEEFKKMLAETEDNDGGWFAGFRQKLLIQTPILAETGPFKWAVGIYGDDVFRALFGMIYLYIEYYFYVDLKASYNTMFIENLLLHERDVLAHLPQLSEKAELSEHLDACKNFDDFFAAELSPAFSYKENIIGASLAKHMINTRLYEYCAEKTFVSRRFSIQRLGRWCAERDRIHESGEAEVISATTLVAPWLKRGIFGLSLARSVAHNLPTLRKWALLLSGWGHLTSDLLKKTTSLGEKASSKDEKQRNEAEKMLTRVENGVGFCFDLLQQAFIYGRYFKQAYIKHQQACREYIKRNAGQLFTVLSQQPATVPVSKDQILLQKKEKLAEFFDQMPENSFLSWMRYKENCCNWTTIWVELALLTPVWVKAGKYGYEYFTQQ